MKLVSMFCFAAVAGFARSADFACDSTADTLWGAQTTGLRTCSGANNVTLLDAVGLGNLTRLGQSFGGTPFTKSELNCMLTQTKYPGVSATLATCLAILAPPAGAPNEERLMASMGVSKSSDGSGDLVANCKPGEPCKVFNAFLVNGTMEKAASHCGVLKKLTSALATRSFIKTAKLSSAMQSSASGLSDQCFCALPDGEGARGPIYGPIFYANAALAYMAGGIEVLGLLPGCRALCAPGTECAPL